MKGVGLVVICMLVVSSIHAQDIYERHRAAAERDRNLLLLSMEGGFSARSLQDLVDASPVIIRGRYGASVSQSSAPGMGPPMRVVEIQIDEIIKGNELLVDASTLHLAMAETPGAEEQFPWLREHRLGEHLFFLGDDFGDGYSLRGPMFDFRNNDAAWMYLHMEAYGRAEDREYRTAFGSESAAGFLDSIKQLAR